MGQEVVRDAGEVKTRAYLVKNLLLNGVNLARYDGIVNVGSGCGVFCGGNRNL